MSLLRDLWTSGQKIPYRRQGGNSTIFYPKLCVTGQIFGNKREIMSDSNKFPHSKTNAEAGAGLYIQKGRKTAERQRGTHPAKVRKGTKIH